MANVCIEGVESYKLDQFLYSNHTIHSVSINREKISSVRITPNVFTTPKELDILVHGIEAFAKSVM